MASRGTLKTAALALFALGVVDLLVLDLVVAPRALQRGAHAMVERADAEGALPPPPEAVVTPPKQRAPQQRPREDVSPPPRPLPRAAPDGGEVAREADEPSSPPLRPIEDLLFDEGSIDLTRTSRRKLWTVVWILRRRPDARVSFRGHYDSESAREGEQFGRSRGVAAASFVVEQGSIEPQRVASGVSATDQQSTGADERRVEVIWR